MEQMLFQLALAFATLGHTDFKARNQANEYLFRTLPVSAPHISLLAESKDPEVARRAQRLLSLLPTYVWYGFGFNPEPIEAPVELQYEYHGHMWFMNQPLQAEFLRQLRPRSPLLGPRPVQ